MAMSEVVNPATKSAVGSDSLPRPVTVSVRQLDVKYRVFQEELPSLGQAFRRGFRSRRFVEVHAIKGVSLEIRSGEVVGLLGANGSGKSTLLRAIAGLQAKTAGEVLVRGEPHLLGVNAALKPMLSGYRNILLGGLAMGLSRAEITKRIGEVVEFSGLGEAAGRPMQTYSSGMRARLAFSIATLRIPDILLIDEALAVGDLAFREKSLQRINEIRNTANTVVLVTHNLSEIRSTCDRAVWLDAGTVRADGDSATVIEQYEAWVS
jgi:teichoic acid transport system ATP-binding protein